MSLNEKYIINGSTLSDIGDAIRSRLPLGGAKIVSTTAKARSHYITKYITGTNPWFSAEFKTFFPDLNPAGWYYISNSSGVSYGNLTPSSTEEHPSGGIYLGAKPTGTISALRDWYAAISSNQYGNPSTLKLTIYPVDEKGNFYPASQEQEGTERTGSFNFGPELIQVANIAQTIINSLQAKSAITIDYEGLSYGFITIGSSASEFYTYSQKNSWLTFIPLTSGQKIGFCVGETVSNRLRAGFFKGKTYSNFQQYVNQSGSNTKVIGNGVLVTGSSDLSGDGLLKRFYYTAPSDGELIVMTSSNGTAARLHVWEVK